MNKVEALTELLTKIEAGENLMLGGTAKFEVLGTGQGFRAASAYCGSLDAAESLHKEVLPKWAWAEMRLSTRPKVTIGFCDVLVEGQCVDLSCAWLIAIVKAKIKEATNNPPVGEGENK